MYEFDCDIKETKEKIRAKTNDDMAEEAQTLFSKYARTIPRSCMPRRKKLTNKWDLIKIKVPEDEIEYFKSCIPRTRHRTYPTLQ